MTRIGYTRTAIADIKTARAYYRDINEGLGDYFRRSLLADIARLRVTAGVHRKAHRHYHRALCRDFPYGIFYTLDKGEVVIWAVIDLRCDPEWIQKHIGC